MKDSSFEDLVGKRVLNPYGGDNNSDYIIKKIVEECNEMPSYYRRDEPHSKFDGETYTDIKFVVHFTNGHKSIYRKLHNILIDPNK